jgi:excisionase family DNA binding protein
MTIGSATRQHEPASDEDRKEEASKNCEPVITAAEACKLLGVKRSGTVLKWAREGKIPCIRLGQGKGAYVRFRASALDAWMRERLDSSALPLASSPEG